MKLHPRIAKFGVKAALAGVATLVIGLVAKTEYEMAEEIDDHYDDKIAEHKRKKQLKKNSTSE